ncbi:acetylcholinesterase-1-like [Panonychus citri]|uniref:Carboxylic ester hydrolase n=1 Tax=Panonychus citri TaxID=50023 RepID=I1YD24_PANCT|nr:acetylcholinesterase-1-like [Panonychus citri]AFI99933.1 esterase 3 [Panonychus citri]
MKLIILTLIISILSKVSSNDSNNFNCSDPLVKIQWSWLRGFTRQILDTPVHHFLGIPYALPPVGPLRFKPTIPLRGHHLHHKGVYNATSYQFGCIQTPEDEAKHSTIPSSENCLFINVYTPANLSLVGLPRNPKLPVLVFIHGSGFVYGSSGNPHIYGGYLAGLGNMVFVVFNYRLGALGLMSGHPTKIPGNLALWDQKAALEWVQNNIDAFGGDPKRVTLMGHSAGANFATMHLMSKETRPLFQQAMVMSGIACKRSGLDSPLLALRKTREVTRRVNCSRVTLENVPLLDEEIDCLMRVDALEIAQAQGSLESTEPNQCGGSIFLPSYGNAFLPHSTDTLAQRGDHVHGKPILVGKVPIETLAVLNVTSLTSAANQIQSYITKTTGVVQPEHLQAILKYYLNSIESDDDSKQLTGSVISAINDLCQHCPLLSFSRQWATGNPVYQYYYTYVTSGYKNDPIRAYGPLHADDTKILFGLPFEDADEYTDSDRQVSKFMINLWSHFVHKGSMEWPPVLINSFSRNKSIMYQYEIDGINNTTIDFKNIDIDPDSFICGLLP